MAPGHSGRRRGRGGRNIKGHERKQETPTLRGEMPTAGRVKIRKVKSKVRIPY